MNKRMYLGMQSITAEISYTNVLNCYLIGIHIGGIYTILDEKFDTEQGAICFLKQKFICY